MKQYSFYFASISHQASHLYAQNSKPTTNNKTVTLNLDEPSKKKENQNEELMDIETTETVKDKDKEYNVENKDLDKSVDEEVGYDFKSPQKKLEKMNKTKIDPEEQVLNECFITWKFIISRLSHYMYISYIWSKCIDDTLDLAYQNPTIFESKSVVSKDHIFSGNPFIEY